MRAMQYSAWSAGSSRLSSSAVMKFWREEVRTQRGEGGRDRKRKRERQEEEERETERGRERDRKRKRASQRERVRESESESDRDRDRDRERADRQTDRNSQTWKERHISFNYFNVP